MFENCHTEFEESAMWCLCFHYSKIPTAIMLLLFLLTKVDRYKQSLVKMGQSLSATLMRDSEPQ
jgi:hypothetical protein